MKYTTLFLASLGLGHAQLTPTAVLDSGPIFGVQTSLPNASAPVNKFLGIPYGQPPVRFGMPVPASPWTAPRNATAFGANCLATGAHLELVPGGAILAQLITAPPLQSEDCLFINVFAPANAIGRALPVVVQISGGGFQSSSGSVDYSGFAGYEGIIAMSINYRTNIFGFPNSEQIPVGQRNLGLHDQRLALDWIQRNAAAFGGDPSKVTIWGGSAGSMSIGFHIQSYYNKATPFRGAILSSGQAVVGQLATFPGNPNDYSDWQAITAAVGCNVTDSLDCMRNIPAATLQGSQYMLLPNGFIPIIDSVTVMPEPVTAWKNGQVAKVPLLNTNVVQEGRVLIDQDYTQAQFIQTFLSPPFVTATQQASILSYYQNQPGVHTPFDLITSIYTDMLWVCPQNRLSAYASAIGVPSWRYHFNETIYELFGDQYSWLGPFHGSDVLLATVSPTLIAPGMTPELIAIAKYVRLSMANFVKNPSTGPGWPAFGSQAAENAVVIGNFSSTVVGGVTLVNDNKLYEQCSLFDAIYDSIAAATN